MYFLKTKGTEHISDFIEIRDENYTLVKYIKLSSLKKNLSQIISEYKLVTPSDKILSIINSTPTGQIIKIE